MGALFAGQLNSGINAAWVLTYLAHLPEARERAFREVEAVVDRHSPLASDLPFIERLADLPHEVWENDFTFLEACLNESIRLNLNGSAFRKNISRDSIPLPGTNEEIPPNFYVTYPIADIHRNQQVYPDPAKYDPYRFVDIDPVTGLATKKEPEPKDQPYTFLGWGAGRHPCLGMRFAKLEQNIIVAFFLAYFDFELAEPKGRVPDIDVNGHNAKKPNEDVRIRYWKRT